MQPQSYVFMGRAGAGKGTQAKLLIKLLETKFPQAGVFEIEPGAAFRKLAEKDNFTAKLTKKVIDNGELMPAFMPVYVWSSMLVENFTGKENLVFDGTPRRVMEAQYLESIFPFYSLGKPWVIYLDIDHDESWKRLAVRAKEGRMDDHKEAVERRRVAFENDIRPTIEFYRANPNVNFLDIDGERPIEEVHADIVKRVGLV